MAVPVVLGDIDAGAVEDLIGLCARYHQIRTSAPDQIRTSAPDQIRTSAPDQISSGAPDPAGWPGRAGGQDATGRGAQNPAATPDSGGNTVLPDGLTGRAAEQATMVAEALAEMERQILAKVLQVVSGPGGVASFLRRNLLGKGLNGPSLPLDVGQTDDIPVHLRRLVALRDQGCQYPGGCDQPAAGCEAHHVVHRADGGRTSLDNLKDYCWWHHHVVLHQLGWTLKAHPDGTSQVTSPVGKIIRSHSPPPRPG